MATQAMADGWSRWAAGEPATFGDIGLVAAHPCFPAAVQALGASAVATALASAEMLHIAKDAGRYMTALAAIHLALEGDLTVPRLQALCVESGLLSAGRARQFVAWLEQIGFVARIRDGGGTVAARFGITPSFEAPWTAQLAGPLAAAALIEPRISPLLESWEHPEVRRGFLQLQSQSLVAALAHGMQGGPLFEAFYMPVGSVQILSYLIAAGPGDSLAERNPVAVPVTRVARKFALTPMQVRRVLKRAEALGMLVRSSAGWAFSANAIAGLRMTYAAQLVHLMLPAARALGRREVHEASNLANLPRGPDHRSPERGLGLEAPDGTPH